MSVLPARAASSFTYKEETYRDMRLLGRGGAGIATVDSGVAAFMNPAGLGFAKGISVTALDFGIAGNRNFKDSYSELAPLLSGGGFGASLAETFEPLLSRPLGLQGSFFPHIIAPGILFGGWDYFDFQFLYHDPVYPKLEVETRNDFGLILGLAKSFENRVSIGMSIRYHNRKQLIETYAADSLLNLSLGDLRAAYKKGVGYGLNLGIQLKQPLEGNQRISAGLAIEDLGQTRFKNNTRLPTPLRQYQSVNAGVGYGFKSALVDTTFSFDVKNLLDTEGSYTKKIYTGIEVNLPTLDVRAGFYQGYWTAGFTVKLFPLIDIDAVTYAEELGVIAGQRTNRWFLLGMRMGIDLEGISPSGKKKQKYNLERIR